jgi:LmbE family N-acetylglucosaminyl deacetylase
MIVVRDRRQPRADDAPDPQEFARALVVVAHPDDAEFSFGGTVARLAAEGLEMTYVVCTDGRLGGTDPDRSASEVASSRQAEQADAAAFLGVRNVVFLAMADGTLTPSVELRREIVRQIRRWRPGLVLAHQPLRSLVFPLGASHPDHLAAGEATLSAVYPDARNPRAFPEFLAEGLTPHCVREVWVPGHEHTDLLVDVTPYAERKVGAILRHRSQFVTAADPRSEVQWVVERMRSNGVVAGCDYAESFKRIIADAHALPGPPLEERQGDGAVV